MNPQADPKEVNTPSRSPVMTSFSIVMFWEAFTAPNELELLSSARDPEDDEASLTSEAEAGHTKQERRMKTTHIPNIRVPSRIRIVNETGRAKQTHSEQQMNQLPFVLSWRLLSSLVQIFASERRGCSTGDGLQHKKGVEKQKLHSTTGRATTLTSFWSY